MVYNNKLLAQLINMLYNTSVRKEIFINTNYGGINRGKV